MIIPKNKVLNYNPSQYNNNFKNMYKNIKATFLLLSLINVLVIGFSVPALSNDISDIHSNIYLKQSNGFSLTPYKVNYKLSGYAGFGNTKTGIRYHAYYVKPDENLIRYNIVGTSKKADSFHFNTFMAPDNYPKIRENKNFVNNNNIKVISYYDSKNQENIIVNSLNSVSNVEKKQMKSFVIDSTGYIFGRNSKTSYVIPYNQIPDNSISEEKTEINSELNLDDNYETLIIRNKKAKIISYEKTTKANVWETSTLSMSDKEYVDYLKKEKKTYTYKYKPIKIGKRTENPDYYYNLRKREE